MKPLLTRVSCVSCSGIMGVLLFQAKGPGKVEQLEQNWSGVTTGWAVAERQVQRLRKL